MLNPIEHSRTPEHYAVYRTEPYVVAADVYALNSQMGRGGWTWYTGSAAWMYRVWLEEILGFKLRAGSLSIEPVIPENWPGYVLTFRYGRTEYRIEVENGGERSTQKIRLVDDGETCRGEGSLAGGLQVAEGLGAILIAEGAARLWWEPRFDGVDGDH